MTDIVYAVLLDFSHGFVDSIKGLSFIRQLDQDDEYEELTKPAPPVRTVLQARREKNGAINRPAEKVLRHRERVWKRVLQCAGVNLAIIGMLFCLSLLFNFIVSLFSDGSYGVYITNICCLPFFLITRILMALWFSDVASACLRQLKLQDPPPVDFRLALADTVVSFILCTFFLCQGLLVEYLPIPRISTFLVLVHMNLLNSMYSFEYFWASRSVSLQQRISRVEEHWPYFVGFGAPLTIATSLSSNVIVNGCIFATLFPFFIISSYKANWKRDYPGIEIPKLSIFTLASLLTNKFSTKVKSILLP
ncbi:unnamed protein product [Caenorhabditis angaria]|uniref:Uncharacterized protein n=1 Tax=Caenorhabditis angaria TaxID=860376 RepID=A0A9P1IIQ9_9PELO|nr:unnamed protein product [Caenorhabditis angaria]